MEEAGAEPGPGDDQLWVEDFCGYAVNFFQVLVQEFKGKFYLPPPFAISKLNRPVPSSTAVC